MQQIKLKIENIVLGFIHIFDNIDNVEILNIVVDKKYRKQHIGNKLLYGIINRFCYVCKNTDRLTEVGFHICMVNLHET